MLQWVETQYSPHSGGQLELLNNLKSFPHKSVLFAEQSATHEERVLKSTLSPTIWHFCHIQW